MKRKLLFAALCVVSALGFKANAGTDVTASYIGNLDEAAGKNGEAYGHKESDGKGWWNNQTTGLGWHAFTKNGTAFESWTSGFGGAGVMIGRTMVLPSGNYTLSFDAFGCNATNSADPSTMPSAGDAVAFLTGKDNVDITNTAAAGDATFHNISYTFDVTTDNTAFEFGIKKLTDDSKIDWCQIKNVSLVLNSTDVFPVANNNVSGFTYSLGNEGDGWHTNTWSTEGQWDGSRFQVPFHELWKSKESGGLLNATITASHTPTETGVYKVSAWVRVVNENGGAVNGVNIFVGDAEADACSGSSVISGKGRLGTYTAMADGVAGTPFTFGFKINGSNANWLSFKNVTITYLGDLPQSEIDALLALVPTTQMNATIQSTLNGYVSALESVKSVANYNNLALYIPTAQASADEYSKIATAISTYATKAAALDAAGQAAYDASGVQTKYDNGTYVTLSEAEAELEAAYVTAVRAQTSEGRDLTGLIINPSFETGNFNGWTNDGMATQNNSSFSIKVGTYYAEAWQPNGTKSVRQTISELPVGIYSIKAKAYARGVTSAKLIADLSKKSITVEADAAEYTLEFLLHSAGDLTFGFEGVGTGAANSWLCVDDFSMTFVRAATDDDYVALFNSLKVEATELLESEPNITGIERTNVNNAIAATPSTRDEYITASEALNTAINNFKAVKGSYDTYAAAKAVNYPDNKPYASAEKYAAITTAQAAGDATSASDAEAKTAAIISAYRKYVESNALAEGINGGNKTSLISDSNFAGVSIDTGNKKAGAWSYSQDGGAPGVLNSESFTDGEGNNNYNYFDYWNGDNNNQHLTQTISNLPAGKYLLTVTARADATFNNYFYLKVTDGEDNVTEDIPAIGNSGGTFNRGWNDVSLEFTHANNGDVTIEVYSDGGSGENKRSGWWGATRFRLAQIGEVVTISARGFSTLYTGYALDFSKATPATTPADDLTAYTGTYSEEIVAEEVIGTLTLEPVSTVPANTGVVLKGTAGTTYNVPVIASSSTEKGDLTGSVTDDTVVDEALKAAYDIYGLAWNETESKVQFTLVSGGTIAAGKAFLKLDKGAGAKVLRVVVDGQASEVTAPEIVETEEPEVLYNMAGIPVGKDFKGYVINQKGEKRLQR